jgi:hypothetical protein
MPSTAEEIVERYAAAADAHATGSGAAPLTGDAAAAWAAADRGAGRLGAARVRDSARRTWIVEARRDPGRGRLLVLSPAHGDNEPFRASADGYRPDTHLPLPAVDWTLLALLVAGCEADGEGRADEELRAAAFRVVDRLVREAQHRQLMGAAEDEDDEG